MKSSAALAIVLVLGLAGNCYGSDLESWLRKALAQTAAPDIAASDKAVVAECLAAAMVAGISNGDQERIVAAIRTRKLDRSTNDLFERYLGLSPLDGPVVEPTPSDPSTYVGGKLHYKSGREVQPIDPAQATTIKTVASARCPDLVERYPRAFKL